MKSPQIKLNYFSIRSLISVIVFNLSSCAIAPPPAPKQTTPALTQWLSKPPVGSELSAASVNQNTLKQNHSWLNFGNTTLADLLTRAGQQNTDLKASAERIIQAREQFNIAHSTFWPQLTATASSSHNSSDPSQANALTRQKQAQLSLNYEVDLRGKIRAESSAAHLNLEATEFDFNALNLITRADTARAYASWLNYSDRIKLASERLSAEKKVLNIIQARADAGAASELELSQEKSDVASSEANLIVLQQQRDSLFNQIAVLAGEAPQTLAAHLNPNAATGLDTLHPDAAHLVRPADIIQQRPDIRRAELALKAAYYDVEAAKAALFPQLNLSAVAIAIFSPTAHATEWSANLLAPIFNGGALNSARELKSARERELTANYQTSILTAFKEVETAMQAINAANNKIHALNIAEAQSQIAYQISRQRYEAGAIDFQTLLVTQRSLLQVSDSLAQAKLDQILALIDLFSSCGG